MSLTWKQRSPRKGLEPMLLKRLWLRLQQHDWTWSASFMRSVLIGQISCRGILTVLKALRVPPRQG